ncbi:MAG: LysR family transcriptional regulator [Pseudomonadota bacterium]
MLEIKPLAVLRAVSDLQSFSGAAKELGLAPASVTRIIAQLERDLGTQLLVRTTRQVALTSAGASVLARYRPLLEGFEAVTRDVQRALRPDTGHLRLSAPVSLGVALLPRVIAAFRQAYPEITVDIQFTDRLIDVMQETCDLAIRVSGPPQDKSTIWRKLCEVPRRMVAAPALLRQVGDIAHPDDLPADALMSYNSDGAAEQWSLSRSGMRRVIQAGRDVVANNGDFLRAMAEAGQGICVLPDFISAPGLRDGTLVEVLPDWQVASLWLTLFYPPYEQLPPVVKTFADFFEAFVADQPELSVSS